jgi:threonine/homoserine/homoserine lactone efflux protein
VAFAGHVISSFCGMKNILLLGFFIGFTTASPLGPIGLLCLRRTLSRGTGTGLISALGISGAYAFWSFAAVHGVAAAAHWLEQEKLLLQLVIGLFFLLYGMHGIFNTPSTDYPTLRQRGGIPEFLSTFLVVFLNPTTFIMFSALFTLFGIARSDYGLLESLQIALTIFLGAMAFWLIVAQVVQLARKHIHEASFGSISRLSSCAIVLFGAAICLHCLYGYLNLAT